MNKQASIHANDIDYHPLTEPVNNADISVYKQLYPTDPFYTKANIVMGLGAVMIGLAIFLPIIQEKNPYFFEDLPLWAVILGAGVIIALLGLIVWAILRSASRDIQEKAAIYKFAQQNGFSYIPKDVPSDEYENEPGTLFSGESAGRTVELLQLKVAGMPAKVGNYMYSVYNGKNYSEYHRGYIRLELPRSVPQMLLDSKANDERVAGIRIWSSITNKYKKSQILSLEGNFDTYFTLYCPKEYERDALYIFTPDLMSLLIDNANTYDVEIAGDVMYIYHTDYFALSDAATWQRLMHIAEVIGKKMQSQTDNYKDERVSILPQDQVAAGTPELRNISPLRGRVIQAVVTLIIAGIMVWVINVLVPSR